MSQPMERLNAYSMSNQDGSIAVDVPGMVLDLTTIMKAGGYPKETLIKMVTDTWNETVVTIDTTKVRKDS